MVWYLVTMDRSERLDKMFYVQITGIKKFLCMSLSSIRLNIRKLIGSSKKYIYGALWTQRSISKDHLWFTIFVTIFVLPYFLHSFSQFSFLHTLNLQYDFLKQHVSRCFSKYVFLKILQYSQKNTYVGVSF